MLSRGKGSQTRDDRGSLSYSVAPTPPKGEDRPMGKCLFMLGLALGDSKQSVGPLWAPVGAGPRVERGLETLGFSRVLPAAPTRTLPAFAL